MYTTPDILEYQTDIMANNTVNQSSGNIPKRIPHDSAQWFKELEEQANVLAPNDMERYFDENEFYFYLIISVLTLTFMVGTILLYCFCCVWALKGNLDLPRPGEDPTSKVQVYIKNPFPSILMYFRHEVEKPPDNKPNGHAGCHRSSNHTSLQKITSSRITTISSKAAGDRRHSKSFENRAKDLCDSYKQFQQFKYDIHDDEPEDVVFDLYDLQK